LANFGRAVPLLARGRPPFRRQNKRQISALKRRQQFGGAILPPLLADHRVAPGSKPPGPISASTARPLLGRANCSSAWSIGVEKPCSPPLRDRSDQSRLDRLRRRRRPRSLRSARSGWARCRGLMGERGVGRVWSRKVQRIWVKWRWYWRQVQSRTKNPHTIRLPAALCLHKRKPHLFKNILCLS